MPRRRRRRSKRQIRRRRLIAAILLSPLWLYVLAALIGSLISVNRGWAEPDRGITVLLASNGVHADIVMPLAAGGLDWSGDFPPEHFTAPPLGARWIAFGAGERAVYLETPRWRDLKPRTALRAVLGGERVLHVELSETPGGTLREIRLRPEEYRRLWSAIRADFRLDREGKVQRIDHPGYGPRDAFYLGQGRIGALLSCNAWAASKLRTAGVRTSLWPPFVSGLIWRYRRVK